MMITLDKLRKIMPRAGSRAEIFHPHIEATLVEFEINTPRRIAAFLAQLAHESGELRYVEEIASGAAYEGRKDLGNTEPGDGIKYKGRGLIQITGRSNYLQCTNYFGVDFIVQPDLLARPEWAARAAGWFWYSRKLNRLADVWDFRAITKKVNGGYNGYAQRETYYKAALAVYDEQAPAPVEERSFQPSEEKPMLPFIAAAIPLLIKSAPDLIRVFGNGEQSEKNAQAAEKVVEIAKVVTGETTAEGAVARIQTDPAAREAFTAETRAQFLEIEALGEKRVQAAREFNKIEPTLFGGVKFVHILTIILTLWVVAFLSYYFTMLDDNAKMMVLTAVVSTLTGVLGYWIGSSSGSDKKTEFMRRENG